MTVVQLEFEKEYQYTAVRIFVNCAEKDNKG